MSGFARKAANHAGVSISPMQTLSTPPPNQIAYELQRKAYGLRVDRLRKRVLAANPAPKMRDASPVSKTPAPRKAVRPGGRLVREWRGRQYEVFVADDGCYLNGRRFRSLSAAAEAITGVKRNGPAFFGLRSPRSDAR